MQATDAANQAPRLQMSLENLPAGAIEVPAPQVEGCQPQGDHGQLKAFQIQAGEQVTESICLSAFVLTEQAENEWQASAMRQMFDQILSDPEAMIVQTGAAPAAGVEVLSPLPPVGEKAAGFMQRDRGQRHEILIFRRGDVVSSVAIHYADGKSPAVPLSTVAAQLDRQLAQSAGSAPSLGSN